MILAEESGQGAGPATVEEEKGDGGREVNRDTDEEQRGDRECLFCSDCMGGGGVVLMMTHAMVIGD